MVVVVVEGGEETCWLDVAPNTCGCELGDYE